MSTQLTQKQNNSPATAEARRQEYRKPYYTVNSTNDHYEVDVWMPGTGRGDARITLEGDQLTIEGTRRLPTNDAWKAVHREISPADYRLQLQLNVELNAEKITARSENGILRVTLPVAEAAKPKAIKVE